MGRCKLDCPDGERECCICCTKQDSCQFTGMTDKNGVRIWKNDIVEAWSQGSRAIGTVKQRVDGLWIMSPAWQNHEFWELKPNSNGETTVEVLGNAFDNLKLLQEESDE